MRRNWPILAYGWLMTLCSGFGQTYFVSVFGGVIRGDLGLSHTLYGTCYSAGTLASAVVLVWAGRLIDRIPLRTFSIATVLGLALATVLVAHAHSAAGLAFAFFATRFFGQGMMIHAAITTMGRRFALERGRAVSLALTGHVAGSAVLPFVAVGLLGQMHWRSAWLLAGAALVVAAVPSIVVLLAREARDTDREMRPDPPGAAAVETKPTSSAANATTATAADWTLSQVLRDPGLYIRLGVLLAPAFITTGLIFHQVHVGAQKGWSLQLIAGALAAYAVGSFVMTLAAGPLVDRFTARRMVPTALAPLALSCLVLAAGHSDASALTFFALMGLGTGLTQVLSGAIWAELYGTVHLGSIRAFAASASVLSSGLAPGAFGFLLDRGASVGSIAIGCALYCVAASLLALTATRGLALPRQRL
ncbi:MAG: MFS transporter [Hyphomicrobiaceae bacterium]